MKKSTQINQHLVVAAGLAITAGAQGAWSVVQSPSPVLIAATQTVTMGSTLGSGSAGLFTFSFGYDDFGDSSWASDMRIEITNSASPHIFVRIGGLDNPPPPPPPPLPPRVIQLFLFTPAYDGPTSDPSGIYSDSIDLSSTGLSGTGTWTVTLTNDWGGDPNPNEIGGFTGTGLLAGNNPFTFTLGGVTSIPSPGAFALFGIAGLAATRRRLRCAH